MFEVGNKEVGIRLFSPMPSDRTRSSGHNPKCKKFHLNIKSFFTVKVVKCWNRFSKEIVESTSLEVIKI